MNHLYKEETYTKCWVRGLDQQDLGPGFGPTRPHLDGLGQGWFWALRPTAPSLVRTEVYRGFRNDDLPQNIQN